MKCNSRPARTALATPVRYPFRSKSSMPTFRRPHTDSGICPWQVNNKKPSHLDMRANESPGKCTTKSGNPFRIALMATNTNPGELCSYEPLPLRRFSRLFSRYEFSISTLYRRCPPGVLKGIKPPSFSILLSVNKLTRKYCAASFAVIKLWRSYSTIKPSPLLQSLYQRSHMNLQVTEIIAQVTH